MLLKKLRQQSHISQIDTAKAIGVHLNTYVLWEKGAGNPNAENLKKIEDVFGINKFGVGGSKDNEYCRRKYILDYIGMDPVDYDKKIKKICDDLEY